MRREDFLAKKVSKSQLDLIRAIETDYYNLASAVEKSESIPVNAHRTAALRLLLESKMTLIHGITHP